MRLLAIVDVVIIIAIVGSSSHIDGNYEAVSSGITLKLSVTHLVGTCECGHVGQQVLGLLQLSVDIALGSLVAAAVVVVGLPSVVGINKTTINDSYSHS